MNGKILKLRMVRGDKSFVLTALAHQLHTNIHTTKKNCHCYSAFICTTVSFWWTKKKREKARNKLQYNVLPFTFTLVQSYSLPVHFSIYSLSTQMKMRFCAVEAAKAKAKRAEKMWMKIAVNWKIDIVWFVIVGKSEEENIDEKVFIEDVCDEERARELNETSSNIVCQ